MLIIVFGLPGSGKSFFAKKLASELKAHYYSSDRFRKKLFKNPTYSEEEKEAVYDQIVRRIMEEKPNSAIVDGTFYKLKLRNKFQALDRPLFWIEVHAGEDVIRKRLAEDREDSDADIMVYEKIKEQFEPFKSLYLSLESGDINKMISEALKYIKASKNE